METDMPRQAIVGPSHDTKKNSKVTGSPYQPILKNKAPTGQNKEFFVQSYFIRAGKTTDRKRVGKAKEDTIHHAKLGFCCIKYIIK